MDIRITLTSQGSGESKIVSLPAGWDQAVLSLQRDAVYSGVQKYFKSTLGFYGNDGTYDGFRDWLLQQELLYGVDAIIENLVEFTDDEITWYELFNGEMPLNELIETINENGHNVEATFGSSGFWAKLISRIETPVNLLATTDLDGNALTPITPLNIKFTAQPIDEFSTYTGHAGSSTNVDNCECASTGNITLTGHQTIDGILTTEKLRVLLKDQTDPKENGLYNASSGTWTRTPDSNTGVELQGLIVFVTSGTVNSGKTFRQTTTPVIIGTSSIVFIETNYVDDYKIFDQFVIWGPGNPDVIRYSHLSPTKKLDDIKDTFALGTEVIMDAVNDVHADVTKVVPIVELNQDGGDLNFSGTFNFQFDYDFKYGLYNGGHQAVKSVTAQVYIYVQKNAETPILITGANDVYNTGFSLIPNGSSAKQEFKCRLNVPISSFSQDVLGLLSADQVKLYAEYIFSIQFLDGSSSNDLLFDTGRGNIYGGLTATNLTLKLISTAPASTSTMFFLHDIFSLVVERITGQSNGVLSPYLGNPDVAIGNYTEIGCASNFAAIKGLQARGYTLVEKPHFESFKSVFEGVNAILCLGIGERVVDGINKVFIGHKKEFFDKDNVSVRLSWVMNITRSYDQDTQINTARFGYEKFETADLTTFANSGLDEVCTEKTFADRFQKVGKPFEMIAKWVAGALTFERVRRSVKALKSDTSYDDDTFIISLIKDGIYRPKTGADLNSVSNVTNSDYRYNLDITPARNFYRWRKFLYGCLQSYVGSFFKFQSGKGNYDAVTNLTSTCEEEFSGADLSEKQDIEVTNEYLSLSELFKITQHPLTFQELLLIMANPEYAIEISQTDQNYKRFFLKNLDMVLANGKIDLDAWSYDRFIIKNVQNDLENGRVFSGEFSPPFS